MYEPAPKSTPFLVDRSKFDPIVDPIARAHGAEIVDVEFKSEQSGWVLRVFVEKHGSAERQATTQDAAIDLEFCSKIAKDLSPALDVVDLIPHRYHLEVSSPGLERPLKKRGDYARFSGKKAKFKLQTAVRGQKVITGVIGRLHGDVLDVDDDGRVYSFAIADITSARLVFEFPPSPKSTPPKKKKK